MLLFVFLLTFTVAGQELNCVITVNSDQVSQTNQQIFRTLERSLNDFVNKNKWTNRVYKENERVNARMFITVNKFESNRFEANIQIQSSRPVFNTSYESPVFNYKDNQFNFEYIEFQPLIYNQNVFSSNLVGVIAYRTVENEFGGALQLIQMDLFETIRYIAKVAALVLLKCCGILIVLALVDFLFVRWELEQKMKMTKQELKEEHKDTEGDPYVKARIRSIQQQMARKRMMAEVPKADVIITNPTHISVAIVYRRGEMDAPQIVAKGADHLAMRIREIAKEHNVPLVENVPVARALHKVEVGTSIPEELFKAVAEILAYVYNLKGYKG